MKKVLGIIVAVAMATGVHATEEETSSEVGEIGVGFQGLFLGDVLAGVAVRGVPSPIGWQAELVQGTLEVDATGGLEADLTVLKGKAYYALIERERSTFYVGASIGYWKGELNNAVAALKTDFDGWSIAPLMGVEWRFSELPELGFNFEVAYELNELESDTSGSTTPGQNGKTDIGISGINVTTGIIYYF